MLQPGTFPCPSSPVTILTGAWLWCHSQLLQDATQVNVSAGMKPERRSCARAVPHPKPPSPCPAALAVMLSLASESASEHITISGGGLPGRYRAIQLHFHWGSPAGNGSEHTLDGRQLPMEVCEKKPPSRSGSPKPLVWWETVMLEHPKAAMQQVTGLCDSALVGSTVLLHRHLGGEKAADVRLEMFLYHAWAKLPRPSHSEGFGGLCALLGPHTELVNASESKQEHAVPSTSGFFWMKEALLL